MMHYVDIPLTMFRPKLLTLLIDSNLYMPFLAISRPRMGAHSGPNPYRPLSTVIAVIYTHCLTAITVLPISFYCGKLLSVNELNCW